VVTAIVSMVAPITELDKDALIIENNLLPDEVALATVTAVSAESLFQLDSHIFPHFFKIESIPL